MAKTFHLTIAKVSENLFDGEVQSVSLPGREGAFEILAHHEALVSELRSGEIRVICADNTSREFPITKTGLIEVSGKQATVLL